MWSASIMASARGAKQNGRGVIHARLRFAGPSAPSVSPVSSLLFRRLKSDDFNAKEDMVARDDS